MNEQEVKEVLDQEYGVKADSVKKLIAYEDENFKIEAQGKIYTFKYCLAGSKESLIFQNKMMDYLFNLGFPVPKPIRNNEGLTVVPYKKRFVKLLTYIPGTQLYDQKLTKEMAFKVGKLVGKIEKALQDFSDDYVINKAPWDLQNLSKIEEFIEEIDDERIKRKVKEIVKEWKKVNLSKLRKGVVHNDLHQWNILVDGEEIRGVIDFGDATYTPYINDIAITIVTFLFGKEKPFELANEIFKGYQKVFPLPKEEKQLLGLAMAARLAVSFTIGNHTLKLNPENNYVRDGFRDVTKLLRKFWPNPLSKDNFLNQK